MAQRGQGGLGPGLGCSPAGTGPGAGSIAKRVATEMLTVVGRGPSERHLRQFVAVAAEMVVVDGVESHQSRIPWWKRWWPPFRWGRQPTPAPSHRYRPRLLGSSGLVGPLAAGGCRAPDRSRFVRVERPRLLTVCGSGQRRRDGVLQPAEPSGDRRPDSPRDMPEPRSGGIDRPRPATRQRPRG